MTENLTRLSWPGWMWFAVAQGVPWPKVLAVAGLIVLVGGFALLVERQRRETLTAVLQQAPGGSVVFQGRGVGGPPMWIWVGKKDPQPVPLVTVLVLSERLPRGGRGD